MRAALSLGLVVVSLIVVGVPVRAQIALKPPPPPGAPPAPVPARTIGPYVSALRPATKVIVPGRISYEVELTNVGAQAATTTVAVKTLSVGNLTIVTGPEIHRAVVTIPAGGHATTSFSDDAHVCSGIGIYDITLSNGASRKLYTTTTCSMTASVSDATPADARSGLSAGKVACGTLSVYAGDCRQPNVTSLVTNHTSAPVTVLLEALDATGHVAGTSPRLDLRPGRSDSANTSVGAPFGVTSDFHLRLRNSVSDRPDASPNVFSPDATVHATSRCSVQVAEFDAAQVAY